MIGTWNKIKHGKGFYVSTYRKALTLTMGSLFLNILLILGIIYAYIQTPRTHFYATNGAIALMSITDQPEKYELQPLDQPNYSDQALLPPDPPDEGTGLSPNVS